MSGSGQSDLPELIRMSLLWGKSQEQRSKNRKLGGRRPLRGLGQISDGLLIQEGQLLDVATGWQKRVGARLQHVQ